LLPEHYRYQDDGCDLFPFCLNCPFPQCRYDEPGRRQRRKEMRNGDMLRLLGEGKGIKELAQRFGVSKRTVYRIMRRSYNE
jgi:transposase-like protein